MTAAKGGWYKHRIRRWDQAHYQCVWSADNPAPEWWVWSDLAWLAHQDMKESGPEMIERFGWQSKQIKKLRSMVAEIREDYPGWKPFGKPRGIRVKKAEGTIRISPAQPVVQPTKEESGESLPKRNYQELPGTTGFNSCAGALRDQDGDLDHTPQAPQGAESADKEQAPEPEPVAPAVPKAKTKRSKVLEPTPEELELWATLMGLRGKGNLVLGGPKGRAGATSLKLLRGALEEADSESVILVATWAAKSDDWLPSRWREGTNHHPDTYLRASKFGGYLVSAREWAKKTGHRPANNTPEDMEKARLKAWAERGVWFDQYNRPVYPPFDWQPGGEA